MLSFLTTHRYSVVDIVVLTWFTLAWNDGLIFLAVVLVLAGGFLSGALEGWASRRAVHNKGATP